MVWPLGIRELGDYNTLRSRKGHFFVVSEVSSLIRYAKSFGSREKHCVTIKSWLTLKWTPLILLYDEITRRFLLRSKSFFLMSVHFKVNLPSLSWRGRVGAWGRENKYIIYTDPVGNGSLNVGMAGCRGLCKEEEKIPCEPVQWHFS